MKTSRLLTYVAALTVPALLLVGCTSPTNADQADENIKTAAENFEVQRVIVGISGDGSGRTLFYAEGRCSFELVTQQRVDVTCKYGPDEFRKHIFLKGDRDSVAITQEEAIDVSEYHTRIILKPQSVIPDVDIQVGAP